MQERLAAVVLPACPLMTAAGAYDATGGSSQAAVSGIVNAKVAAAASVVVALSTLNIMCLQLERRKAKSCK